MNIYPSTQVRPYVYFGYNPTTGEFYIGYREANNKPSHIDLFEYRTSSKTVEPMFDQMIWTILAEFDLGDDAYDFEQLSIYENWNNPLLLNDVCYYGKARFKAKKGCNKGKKNPGVAAMMLGNTRFKGKKRPEQAERNKGNTYGKKNKGRTNAWQLGNTFAAGPQEIVKCPYCPKEGGKGAMHRYHFDKCKFKPII